jgi:hypothetical protein
MRDTLYTVIKPRSITGIAHRVTLPRSLIRVLDCTVIPIPPVLADTAPVAILIRIDGTLIAFGLAIPIAAICADRMAAHDSLLCTPATSIPVIAFTTVSRVPVGISYTLDTIKSTAAIASLAGSGSRPIAASPPVAGGAAAITYTIPVLTGIGTMRACWHVVTYCRANSQAQSKEH